MQLQAFLVKPQLPTSDEAITNVKEGMAYTRATHGERLPADREKKRLTKDVSPTQGSMQLGKGSLEQHPLVPNQERCSSPTGKPGSTHMMQVLPANPSMPTN